MLYYNLLYQISYISCAQTVTQQQFRKKDQSGAAFVKTIKNY